AKAESLGFTARGGIMERAERMVLLAIGLAFDILVPVLWIMVVLLGITAVHRFVKVWRQASPERPARAEPTWTTRMTRIGRRRQVERNRRRASDGALQGLALRKAVAETFGSYGRYWLELFRLADDARGTLELDIEGFDHITAGLEHGTGVILALPHVGGW